MYWIGVFLMAIVSFVYLLVIVKQNKVLYLNKVLLVSLSIFTSWVGLILSILFLIIFFMIFLIEEGNDIIIWKSKDY